MNKRDRDHLPSASKKARDAARRGERCERCGQVHTVYRDNPDKRVSGSLRCQAHSVRSGLQCNNVAMGGQGTCRNHGGATVESRAKGRRILLDGIDEALKMLVRLSTTASKDSDKLRAIENMLDRGGYPRASTMALSDARDILADRLRHALDEDDPEAEDDDVDSFDE